MVESYDVVIIGGGTAGCVAAATLCAESDARVLLVEAGPDPRPLPELISDARRQRDLLGSEFVRRYPVERIDGSTATFYSGRVLGGGSSVNQMSTIRPTPVDFAAWAAFGGAAWSYESMLPTMREVETDLDFGHDPLHGDAGPLRIARPFMPGMELPPAAAGVIEAAENLGVELIADVNGRSSEGVGTYPYAIAGGARQSIVQAFVDPMRDHRGLTILADATVRSLEIEDGGVRAVLVDAPDGLRRIVGREVLLAAGVFHSPQLLMLSGVGDPADVRALGVTPRHALPGVGRNLQDHAKAEVAYALEAPADTCGDELKLHLRLRSARAGADPDLDLGLEHLADGRVSVKVRLLEHRRRGHVRPVDADPAALPVIEPELLEDVEDQAVMAEGIERARELLEQPHLADWYGGLLDADAVTDPVGHARRTFGTYNHGVGTNRMGPDSDPEAVVDGGLRVHGLDRLRIIDASVLPVIPHANTNLAAVLTGRIGARSVLADG